MTEPPAISDELLAAYALGEAPAAEVRGIEAALSVSKALRAKLGRIRGTVAALAEPGLESPPAMALQRVLRMVPPAAERAGSWWARAADCLATLVFDSAATPTVAGFRGSIADQRHMTFDCEAGEIDLQVSRSGGRFRILGQVSTTQGATNGWVGIVHAGGARDVQETTLDPKGCFTAEIGPGHWEIKIAIGTRIVDLPPLLLE